MASGDFGASAIVRANRKLTDLIAGPNTAMTEYIEPAESAKFILGNNLARAEERFEGKKCVGIKAWFLRTSTTTNVTAPTTCTTPSGNQAETVSANWDLERLVHAGATILDHRCDNEVDFTDEMAMQMKRMMALMRKGINGIVINRLAAAAQANLDEGIPTTWDDTTETPKVLVPIAELDDWGTLAEMEAMAANNNFSQSLILSGRNFYKDNWKAQFERLNADGKAGFSAYAAQNLRFDLRDLDKTLGYRGTLIVDRNSYVFYNSPVYGAAPVEMGDNKFVWNVTDPEFSYLREGRLVPITYEVEMQKTCSGRDTLGRLIYTYNVYMQLVGTFRTIPTGPNGEKGTLVVKAEV